MIHFYINFHNMTAPGTQTHASIEWPFYKTKYQLHKYIIIFLSIVYDCVMYLPTFIPKQSWEKISNRLSQTILA